MAAEAREETERLERLRSEVKGREYTYDQEGNVIVIETVNPERLPAYQYATRSGMAHEPMPEAVKGKKGTRRPPPAKTPVLRFNQPAKYEELDSIQPPLSETMTMREGVSMTQDGSLSSGPARAADPLRMSKKDFESFVQTASLAEDMAADPSNPVASQLEPSTPLPAIPPAGSEEYGDAAGSPGGDAADDINLQLMAKDWGVNPPQREVNAANKPRYKPNTTQTLGVGRARLPRERGGTGVAEHLPPPLLPATAGWGLGATYGGIPEEPGGGPPPLSGNAGSPIRTVNPQLRQQVLGQ